MRYDWPPVWALFNRFSFCSNDGNGGYHATIYMVIHKRKVRVTLQFPPTCTWSRTSFAITAQFEVALEKYRMKDQRPLDYECRLLRGIYMLRMPRSEHTIDIVIFNRYQSEFSWSRDDGPPKGFTRSLSTLFPRARLLLVTPCQTQDFEYWRNECEVLPLLPLCRWQ